MTPIARPLGWDMGVLREFEVQPKFTFEPAVQSHVAPRYIENLQYYIPTIIAKTNE